MNNNTIAVNNAVEAINEQRKASLMEAAKSILLNIETNQKCIQSRKKRIEECQIKIEALRKPIYTQEQLLGVEYTGSLNQNEDTIVETIESMNAEKQKLVEAQTKIEVENISVQLGGIEVTEKVIESYRKQLSELKLEEVSPSIAG